jgi:hypothetical protein
VGLADTGQAVLDRILVTPERSHGGTRWRRPLGTPPR